MVSAVAHATQIMHWQENLTGDDMPPEWMWPFDDELEEWFDAVEIRRKSPNSMSVEEEFPVANEFAPRMPKAR